MNYYNQSLYKFHKIFLCSLHFIVVIFDSVLPLLFVSVLEFYISPYSDLTYKMFELHSVFKPKVQDILGYSVFSPFVELLLVTFFLLFSNVVNVVSSLFSFNHRILFVQRRDLFFTRPREDPKEYLS